MYTVYLLYLSWSLQEPIYRLWKYVWNFQRPGHDWKFPVASSCWLIFHWGRQCPSWWSHWAFSWTVRVPGNGQVKCVANWPSWMWDLQFTQCHTWVEKVIPKGQMAGLSHGVYHTNPFPWDSIPAPAWTPFLRGAIWRRLAMGKGSDYGHDVTVTSLCIEWSVESPNMFCEFLQFRKESWESFTPPRIKYIYIYIFKHTCMYTWVFF